MISRKADLLVEHSSELEEQLQTDPKKTKIIKHYQETILSENIKQVPINLENYSYKCSKRIYLLLTKINKKRQIVQIKNYTYNVLQNKTEKY